MPITMTHNHGDEMKFWLGQKEQADRQVGNVRMPTLDEAGKKLIRQQQRKLYGTSKYKTDGERYTAGERPWLF